MQNKSLHEPIANPRYPCINIVVVYTYLQHKIKGKNSILLLQSNNRLKLLSRDAPEYLYRARDGWHASTWNIIKYIYIWCIVRQSCAAPIAAHWLICTRDRFRKIAVKSIIPYIMTSLGKRKKRLAWPAINKIRKYRHKHRGTCSQGFSKNWEPLDQLSLSLAGIAQ